MVLVAFKSSDQMQINLVKFHNVSLKIHTHTHANTARTKHNNHTQSSEAATQKQWYQFGKNDLKKKTIKFVIIMLLDLDGQYFVLNYLKVLSQHLSNNTRYIELLVGQLLTVGRLLVLLLRLGLCIRLIVSLGCNLAKNTRQQQKSIQNRRNTTRKQTNKT